MANKRRKPMITPDFNTYTRSGGFASVCVNLPRSTIVNTRDTS